MRIAVLLLGLGLAGCGSTQKCVPGLTQACLGPGACSGAQACASTGDAWEACECSGAGVAGGGGGEGGGTGGDGGGIGAGVDAGPPPALDCRTANGGCSPDAQCAKADGGVACACKVGFSGDGLTCVGDDPSLAALLLAPGALAFSPSTTHYAVEVPSGTPSVVVTATAAQAGRASVEVNGQAVAADGTSTVMLSAAPLAEVTVAVTAESGALKTYTVVIIRRLAQQAYVKASNTELNDAFGNSLALSADGNTLAVGACHEASAATGAGGNQTDNSANYSGAVYVFGRSGKVWEQQAYLKASNSEKLDLFGFAVALSADGNTLAVGAQGESSAARGVAGDQTAQADNSAPASGAAYVFARGPTAWSQEAYVKASNADAYDAFGSTVALSADGSTLAVGARGEASSSKLIDNDEGNNAAPGAGAVYVFRRSGVTWAQQSYLKASNTGALDGFGSSLALSADGNTLAVGGPGEDSGAKGVGASQADQADNSASASGAAYVFVHRATWLLQAYVKASNPEPDDAFGTSVTLSGDGSTLAVGAPGESSGATGVGGDENSNAEMKSGAAYVFHRTGSVWGQQAYLKASNTDAEDAFGSTIALTDDGSTLAVGAPGEASKGTGAWGSQADGGSQADNSMFSSGAAYVFAYRETSWSQQAYVKASNTEAADYLSLSVALNADGTTLALGAPYEDGSALGVDGEASDNGAGSSGAAYVFSR